MRLASSRKGQTVTETLGEETLKRSQLGCFAPTPRPGSEGTRKSLCSFPAGKQREHNCAILNNCTQFGTGSDAQNLLLAKAAPGRTPGSRQGSVPNTWGRSLHLEQRVFSGVGDPEMKQKQTALTSSGREKDVSGKPNF